MMADEFEKVVRFLERAEAEVAGRGDLLPASDLRQQIERMVSGECSEEEKEQICEAVRDHPEWVKWMAEKVKAKRDRPEG